MLRSLHTAATGMKAQQQYIDVTSNNLANVNTSGFKRSRATFQDLMYQVQRAPGAENAQGARVPTGVQVGLGVTHASVEKEFSDGSQRVTDNPFHLRIVGNGFFQIRLPDGNTGYTRDGAFRPNQDGVLVNGAGYPLEPPVTIPPGTTLVTIGQEGQVSAQVGNDTQSDQVLGTLQTASFVNPGGLLAVGGNLFKETPASGAANVGVPGANGHGMLAQGQLELSNVKVVEEMVDLITAQRAFEFNSKAVQASDQMLREVGDLR